jgi:hypothetical protein
MFVTLKWEEDEINLTVRKISKKKKEKKREDQPCHHEESSGQPCNQEAPSFSNLVIKKNPINFRHQEGQMSTLQLGRTDVSPAKSKKKKSIK